MPKADALNWKLWLLISIAVFALDQLTKHWILANFSLGYSQEVLSFFNLVHVHNYGAAFSFLSDQPGWQRWFLGVIAFLVSILLVIWILRLESDQKLELAGLSFILGGATGNLWDRISLGYVVDFIDWYYPASESCFHFFYFRPEWQSCHWPAFNLADSSIFIGASLLILDMLTNQKGKHQ